MTPQTLLDWREQHLQNLAIMRENTARWIKTGVQRHPRRVRVRKAKNMHEASFISA